MSEHKVVSDPNSIVAFQGELMLVNWNDSSSRGRTVTLQLDEESGEHPFKGLQVRDGKKGGQRFYAVLVQLNDDDTPVEQGKDQSAPKDVKPYGKNVSFLHKTGWFTKKRVIEASGEPAEFRKWLSTKGCAVCQKLYMNTLLTGDDRYMAVPVCQDHVDSEYVSLVGVQVKYLKEWISESIASKLGQPSLGYVPPLKLIQWAAENKISDTIPEKYVEI